MILGYSYRYYQDSNGKRYSFREVEKLSQDGGPESQYVLAANPTVPVTVQYVPVDRVQWREETPYHPQDEQVELEPQTDKMSKSRGNVVNPDAVVAEYGADALRCYEMFMGPLEQVKPWNTRSVAGVSRFLARVWSLVVGANGELRSQIVSELVEAPDGLTRLYHKTIKKVTEDIEGMRFHTALSALMTLVNEAYKAERVPRAFIEGIVLALSPFAPHLGEELWRRLGHADSLAYTLWPTYDPELVRDETVTVAIQVNGKLRATVEVAADANQDSTLAAARAHEKIQAYLKGKTLRREIVIAGRLVNLVVA
jgi:leucyl-tRNA synthetase